MNWKYELKLLSSESDARKSMEPDETHPRLLKYLSNEILINTISELIEKCIEYEIIPFI